MTTKFDLIKNLQKEIEGVENQLNNSTFHKLKKFVIRNVLNLGIALEYALPYIIVLVLYFYIYKTEYSTPFKTDLIKKNLNAKTITTSTGITKEMTSFDTNYRGNSLKHSTGWLKNEYGLYEREITTYQIDNQLDLKNKDLILKMTKEELEKMIRIQNIETISKNELSQEDNFYKEDMLILTLTFDLEENYQIVEQSESDNFLESIGYIVASLFSGVALSKIKKIVIKKSLKDKIKNEIKPKYHPLSKEEAEKLRKVLEIKKQNLMILDDNLKKYSSDNANFTYQLSKKKGSRYGKR